MTHRPGLFFVILTATALSGCSGGKGSGALGGGSADPVKLQEEQLKATEEVTALLEKIKDDASAAAVLPDLDKAATRLGAVKERMVKLAQDNKGQDTAAAMAKFNDPKTQEVITKVVDAAGKMLDASLQAQLKAPGKRTEIQAALAKANPTPKPR